MADKRRWAMIGAATVTVAALAGISLSAVLFNRWSEVSSVDESAAERAFARERKAAGGGPAYVEISPSGQVSVRTELELDTPIRLTTLHLLAWQPQARNLLRIAFPMWFVRVKMSRAINLGTLTSVLTGDWGQINLTVSVEELERRGPGVVLDHRLSGGGRILLWTAAEQQ